MGNLVLISSEEAGKSNCLKHYGVRGMKRGIRQYQNEDGSYTPLGRIHYGIGLVKEKMRGGKSQAEIDEERRKHRGEKLNAKIGKTEAKIAKYDTKSNTLLKKATDIERDAERLKKKAEIEGTRATIEKGGSYWDSQDNVMYTDAYEKYLKKSEKLLKLQSKSEKYAQKAERGRAKLEKFRMKLAKLQPEVQKEELNHAGIPEDFFEMFDQLSEKQQNAICALFDDLLPDED